MSAASITVRYDGPALADHRMDVADLAPALLGISELCKLANERYNGDRAVVQVLIGTDQEHKCFQFDLEIVQSLWQQAKALVEHADIKSAKDILEWIGLIGGPILGLFALLKKLKKKKIEKTHFEVRDGRNVVVIQVEGDNNVIVAHREAFEMLAQPTAVEHAKKVVRPLIKPGYDEVQFETENAVTERITKPDAEDIIEAGATISDEDAEEPQRFSAFIQVYSPVWDSKAPQWRFKLGQEVHYMDISETDIARRALERGYFLPNDTYKVRLEMQQVRTPTGFRNKYKVVEVIEYPHDQLRMQADLIPPTDSNDHTTGGR